MNPGGVLGSGEEHLGYPWRGAELKTKALPVQFTAKKSYHRVTFNHSFHPSIWKNKVV